MISGTRAQLLVIGAKEGPMGFTYTRGGVFVYLCRASDMSAPKQVNDDRVSLRGARMLK